MTNSQAMSAVPVIDFAPLLEDEIAGKQKVASAVYEALTQVGFMYIRNAGMPQPLRNRMFKSMEDFFARPAGDKLAV